ncbi:MAG TPA: hypothetical protein DCX54_00200 [Flavobacteriales bacterium]|nr:hypothetical protein [Flavobacteriales bacterium]
MSKKIKVCFVSLYSYPLFKPDSENFFGGSEVRVARFAKGLAKKEEFDVSLIVFDHGQDDLEIHNNVKIIKWPGKISPYNNFLKNDEVSREIIKQEKSTPKAISFIERMIDHKINWIACFFTNIYSILKLGHLLTSSLLHLEKHFGWIGIHSVKKSDIGIFDMLAADIYISPGVNTISAWLGIYCKKRKKKNIILCASDIDYSERHLTKPYSPGIYGSHGFIMAYAIKAASMHVVQTQAQKQQLNNIYHRNSVLIENPARLQGKTKNITNKVGVLWVGKAHPNKQPELFIDLARALPEFQFTMIINYTYNHIYEACLEQGELLENLKVIGFERYERIGRYYDQAKIFINTSLKEGFPNTFLEAALCGTPIISLNVDPQGMLKKYICGVFCEGQVDDLEKSVIEMHEDRASYNQMSKNCMKYVREFHNPSEKVEKLSATIKKLMTANAIVQ